MVPQKSISGHNDRNLSVYRVGNTVQTLERFFCLFKSRFVSYFDYCLVFVLVNAVERTIVPYLVKRSRFNPFLFKRSLVSPSSIMPTLSQK